MKYTNNLNLKKPEQTEFYNVDDFNENADKLDEAINGLNTRVTPIKIGGTGANNAADACKNLGIVDMIYPVGSLYWSKKPTNPEELFGGKWTQIKDKFILAAGDTYNAGATGGEAKHQLTADEMPAHVHRLAFGTTNVSFSFSIRSQSKDAANVLAGTNTTVTRREHNSGYAVEPSSAGYWYRDELSFNQGITPTGTIDSTGGNLPHNNMPPYVTYYCWERTA